MTMMDAEALKMSWLYRRTATNTRRGLVRAELMLESCLESVAAPLVVGMILKLIRLDSIVNTYHELP